MTKQELNYAFDNGILDETQIALDIEMSKRKERLKAHPYDIWQGKDGKWRTYLPEPRSKTGWVQRVRNTREEIEDIISDYQKGLECSPSIREVFEDWNDRRLELEQISKATHNRNQVCFNRHFKDNAGEKIRSMDVFSELEDTELRFKRTKKSDSEEVFTEEEATRIKEYLQDNLDIKNMVLLLVFYSGIRVSSTDQNEDRQYLALKDVGIVEDNIYMDKLSGKDFF